MPLAMLLITLAMDGICCACVTYSPVKSCLKCGDRERAPDRVGSSCGVFCFFAGGGGLRSRMSPVFSCTGCAGCGVALVGGDCRLAACGGGMVLPALLTVPVDEDAVAVLAACIGWQ